VVKGVYAINDFPDDDLLWRIEWIGWVGYNASAPSDARIDVCPKQLPTGEKNRLSARSRSAQNKRTEKIKWAFGIHSDCHTEAPTGGTGLVHRKCKVIDAGRSNKRAENQKMADSVVIRMFRFAP
jgi:hypothetical protein